MRGGALRSRVAIVGALAGSSLGPARGGVAEQRRLQPRPRRRAGARWGDRGLGRGAGALRGEGSLRLGAYRCPSDLETADTLPGLASGKHGGGHAIWDALRPALACDPGGARPLGAVRAARISDLGLDAPYRTRFAWRRIVDLRPASCGIWSRRLLAPSLVPGCVSVWRARPSWRLERWLCNRRAARGMEPARRRHNARALRVRGSLGPRAIPVQHHRADQDTELGRRTSARHLSGGRICRARVGRLALGCRRRSVRPGREPVVGVAPAACDDPRRLRRPDAYDPSCRPGKRRGVARAARRPTST